MAAGNPQSSTTKWLISVLFRAERHHGINLNGPARGNVDPKCSSPHPLLQDQAKDVPPCGAQRQSKANLPGTLRNRIREYAVQAYSGENQRQ